MPRGAQAQAPHTVAAIYTVPVEQQWVSRIHIAAEAAKDAGEIDYTCTENMANTDYQRVMREYAEQGTELIVGEILGSSWRLARLPPISERRFLWGRPSAGRARPEPRGFDNYIQTPPT